MSTEALIPAPPAEHPKLTTAQEFEFYRAEARRDLLSFMQMMDSSYIVSKVHLLLAKKLQDVAEGKCKRLIISTPPRIGKSRMACVEFPAWLLGRNPKEEIVVTSYAQSLSLTHSRGARTRMNDPVYQAIFDTRLRDGDTQLADWGTPEGGRYKAVGVGGGLTGRGASILLCVRPETIITTDRGEIAIKDINAITSPCKVLAYDEVSKQIQFRKIQAVSHRQADGFYRITTAAGRVVEVTAEHPFWTGRGYTRADKLAPGDDLLCAVREGDDYLRLRNHQARKAGAGGLLLLPEMPLCRQQRTPGIPSSEMQTLRQRAAVENHARQQAVLFGEVQGGSAIKSGICSTTAKALSAMREDFSTELAGGDILLAGLREQGAQREDGWHRESCVSARAGGAPSAAQPCRVSPHAPENSEEGRGGVFKAEGDTVSLVEFVCEPTLVYCLSVEGTKNFFANGILTHNCDDLIKDFAEAHSTTVLQNVWDWLWSVAYTRLTPNGAIVLIGTRWSVGDPIGRITDPTYQSTLVDSGVGDKWDVINLPALADVDDPLGRQIGESIFPERFPRERLLQTRAAVGAYVWSALYCGNPVVRGGNYIPVGNFEVISPADVPVNLRWVRGWDLAASEKKSADFTASTSCALDEEGNLYIRDGVRGQWNWPQARDRIRNIAMLERFVPVGIEAVAGFKTAYQNLAEVMPPTIQLREVFANRDKLTRAIPWIALVEKKKVFLVSGEWVMNFIQEAAAFPDPGTHDDMVDSVSIAWTMMSSQVNVFPMRSGQNFQENYRNRRDRTLVG